MLRSLVGSEMCIRDRAGTDATYTVQMENYTWTPSNFVVTDIAANMSCNCLLYTSDAADDLLCVDLGGRRIIKKKKQTTPKGATKNTHTTYQHYHNHQQQQKI